MYKRQVLKAVAKALRRHPEILVSLDGEQIIRRAHVNLGMAVALDAGLIVPVIRDADLLSLEALSAKAKDLAERARANQLGADEYICGGCAENCRCGQRQKGHSHRDVQTFNFFLPCLV